MVYERARRNPVRVITAGYYTASSSGYTLFFTSWVVAAAAAARGGASSMRRGSDIPARNHGVYPVFWSVDGPGSNWGIPPNNTVFNAGGKADIERFGINPNNWTVCGDLTSGWRYSFPELTQESDGSLTPMFGGVPQASNLSAFLSSLHHQVTQKIPCVLLPRVRLHRPHSMLPHTLFLTYSPTTHASSSLH